MVHLIDTSVAVRLRDGEELAEAALSSIGMGLLSVITVVELENGVMADPAESDVRRLRTDELLATMEIAPFDRAAAAVYARIIAKLGYSRKLVLDRMIAATALALGATLVTANHRDVANIPRLSIVPVPPR